MIEQEQEHPEKNLRTLIDWVQLTVKGLTLAEVHELIGIPEHNFVDLPRGLYFYAKQKICGDIRILWEGTNGHDMGIHVQFSGQGCREYETYHDGDWLRLFGRVIGAEGHFTRLDIAVDEIRYGGEKPYFKVRTLIKKTLNGETRSKWKHLNRMQKIRIADGASMGDTGYFGSSLSDIQCRWYEKNKERENAGKTLEDELTTWNRGELQLSDDRAQDAVKAMVNGVLLGDIFFRLIKNYITFTDKIKGDSNKGRWPVCKWWLDFLGGVEKLQLARQAPDRTIDQKKEWVDRQVVPSIAEIWVAEGSPGEEHLWRMIHEGLERMTDTQWARVDVHQQKVTLERVEKQRRIDRRLEQLELANEERIRMRSEVAAAYQNPAYDDMEKEPLERLFQKDSTK